MLFIDSYFADCHYHFHVNGTKLDECHVCYPISYFAVFLHAIYQAIQQELKKDYVLLLRLDGISNWGAIKSTILPDISAIYTQEIARAFVVAILDITALSFIFSWCATPYARMGTMIKDSLELIYLAPWTVLLPGFAIILPILLSIIFTNGLCQAINKYYE